MLIACPTPLLGGLSPRSFMARHWQKKPLLIRRALVDAMPGFDRARLFALAAGDAVESRLVVRDGARWSLRAGPLPRRSLPPLASRAWTVLVQGVDLHDDAARRLLERFRFVADARLDDVMVSFASDGGGVGPHVDSYDVFLLQLAGRRRWRVGRPSTLRLRDDVPLKMLADFVPAHDWLLETGDMLYVPPGWGHDGIAEGECLTASIGFRAPDAKELAAATLQRVAEHAGLRRDGGLYRDAGADATDRPARVPAALQAFNEAAVRACLADRSSLRRALGESLSEPKADTWFERAVAGPAFDAGVVLDRRTRMLYDDACLYINGESLVLPPPTRALWRKLADRRRLEVADLRRLGDEGRALIAQWFEAGWCANIDVDGKESET